MEKEILNLLNQLVDGQDKINQRFDIVENKIELVEDKIELVEKRLDSVEKRLDSVEDKMESVIEHTAILTEFRTETNNQLQEIKENISNVELITASNWKDIAKLKAII